jgi:hypothetical protein
VTLAAPRATAGAGRRLIEPRPLRNPDSADPAFMGRRGWWLVAMNVLVPGSAQILAGRNRKLGRFGLGATLVSWLLVIAGLISALFLRSALIPVLSNWFFLTALQALFVGYAILWIVLTLDTLRLVRLVKVPDVSRIAIPIVALLIVAPAPATGPASPDRAAARSTTSSATAARASTPATATTTSFCSARTAATDATPCASTASRSPPSTPRPVL